MDGWLCLTWTHVCILRPDRHAIISIMDVGDIHFYQDRWQAVEELERQELRAMTPEQHWQKLNAIARFAMEVGMPLDREAEEMKVFLRWAELKAQYEAGQ
jgi:deoxyhypusine synthase